MQKGQGKTGRESALETVIPIWGIPSELHSDRGTYFVDQIVKEICKIWWMMQHFHCDYNSQSSGLVERTNRTIKTQLAKLHVLIPSLGPRPFHQFSSTQIHSFDKYHLSPFEITTGRPMRLHKRLYDPILLKGDILYYCKGLIKLLTSHSKLVSEVYYSNLSSDEDQTSHDLQPGDYVY